MSRLAPVASVTTIAKGRSPPPVDREAQISRIAFSPMWINSTRKCGVAYQGIPLSNARLSLGAYQTLHAYS